jgi:hypothetical protein
VAPRRGSSPQGPPEGVASGAARQWPLIMPEGAIAERGGAGGELAKIVFAFFKNSIMALWCKAIEIR